MKGKYIKSFDKKDIYCYTWDKVENPIGIVQIIHGMQEHAGRYEDFAKFLNKHGYIVFADDHRAHGRTAESIERLGKYDGGNLFYDTLRDEMFFSNMLMKKYNLPLYVFGHSYGSFLTQNYIQNCSSYQKAILCGSACMKNSPDVKFGRLVAKMTMRHKGQDKIARFIEKMMIGKYNKMVGSGSWVNSDPAEVAKYEADPYCGVPSSAKFYYDFFTGLKYSYDKHKLQEINHNKPILLIAGKCDPVGNMGKSVVKLFKLYHEDDLNVSMKLYDNVRHEILNEPSVKETVYNDVLEFLQAPMNKQDIVLEDNDDKKAETKKKKEAKAPKAPKEKVKKTAKKTK